MRRIEIVRDFSQLSGSGRSRSVVAPIDFRAAARAGGVFTSLPAWFSLACATTGRTVQTSASTVVTGLGANARRAYSHDGVTNGLLVECATTSHNTYQQVASFFLTAGGSVGAGTLTAPDGTTAAGRLVWIDSQNFAGGTPNGDALATTALPACASIWAAGSGGTVAIDAWDNASGAWAATKTIGVGWSRIDVSRAAGGGDSYGYWGHRSTAAAGSAFLWGGQLEPNLYPTSLMPGTAPVARAADVASASASVVCPGGFFHARMVVAPIYATAEQEADHNLFFLDTNNRLFLRKSDAKVVLRVGGADIASAALSWARNQAISIEVVHSPRVGRRLVVNGTTTTGAAASAVSLPATAYILGASTGSEEAAALHAISFHREAA